MTGSVLLDIGQDVGALVVYTSAGHRGVEIEVSATGCGQRRHTEVLERRVGSRPVFAAVFATLPAGEYTLWRDARAADCVVTVTGGSVAEVDWRPDRYGPAGHGPRRWGGRRVR